MATKAQRLKTIPFTDLYLWDVKRFSFVFNTTFENAVLLRDILSPYKQPVSKEELIRNNWKIIKKINFHGDLFLRNDSEIESYKGKLNKVPDNSIIYSKINVRHGCVYYHEKGQVPFGVSSEYPVFTFDETKVDGFFLKMVLRSSEFKRLLNTKTSGISKARVKVDEFLAMQIPLPPLAEQKRLVASFNAKIKLAQEQEKKAKQLEQSIESYLFGALGIEKQEKKFKGKGLKTIQYKDMSRWDVWVHLEVVRSEKYDNTRFESVVIQKPMYGANVKGVKEKSDTRYVRITDINEFGGLNDEFASPMFVDEKYLLEENDFLIARSGNTVGKTFLYKDLYGRAIFAGYLVKYVLNTSKIIPEYILLFSKSYVFKKWIEANQRVSGQPNINGQEFLNAPIILPPLNMQEEIVKHISTIKELVRDLQIQVKKNREQAALMFEQEIFSA